LVPGTYTSTEQELTPTDYFLLASITCDDGSSATPSSGDVAARTATFQLDPGETVICTFTNTTTLEGCTPGYWKNHPDRWPTPYSTGQMVASVFSEAGSAPYTELGSASLLQALFFQGGSGLEGAGQILLRAAVASLLNQAHPEITDGFVSPVPDIVGAVNTALASGDRSAILSLATELDNANNGICELGGTPARPPRGANESNPRSKPNNPAVSNRNRSESDESATSSTSGTASGGVNSTSQEASTPLSSGPEGCVALYWASDLSSWAATGYSPDQPVLNLFTAAGSPPYTELGNASLLAALSFQGDSTLQGAAGILLRAAVASVLNHAHPDVAFQSPVANLFVAVDTVLASQDADAILALASQLEAANNASCPLGGTAASSPD
jgi:hypothetical protein